MGGDRMAGRQLGLSQAQAQGRADWHRDPLAALVRLFAPKHQILDDLRWRD
jgi:hypothetical protein